MWLELDAETYSACDLKACGSDRYFADPTTRLLMLAWRWQGEADVHQWDESQGGGIPRDVREALAHPGVRKYAFNTSFEIGATERLLGIETPLASWRCTMAMAAMHGLGGGLAGVGAALGLPEDKQKSIAGRRLIKLFCTPGARAGTWQTHSAKWADFLEYNRQDVEAEHAIRVILERTAQDPSEWDLWQLDQRINRRGVPIDTPFVQAAAAMVARHIETVTRRVELVTEGIAPAMTDAFRDFMREHGGPCYSLDEENRAAALAGNSLDDAGRIALQGLHDISSASVKKFDKMVQAEVGGRLRQQFAFCGADQSGRWSSKGVQLHNLPHPSIRDMPTLLLARGLVEAGDYAGLELLGIDPLDALLSNVRTALAAPPGDVLHVCDLSMIEPRTAAWSTGCKRMLETFAAGLDPYKDFGSGMFGIAYEAISKSQRQQAKPGFLGAGYGLGAVTLIAQAAAMGIALPPDVAERSIQTFAAMYPEILAAWADHESAVRAAIERPGERWPVGPYVWSVQGRFLCCRLPSGRYIRWLDPKMERNRNPQSYKFGRIEITTAGKGASRISQYGSRIFAVVNQATASDVLRAGMRQADAAGLAICAHVHDEIIVQGREGDDGAARLETAMTLDLPWMPGVTLKAEASSGRIYSKP